MAELYCFIQHEIRSTVEEFSLTDGWYKETKNLPEFFSFDDLVATGCHLTKTDLKRIPKLKFNNPYYWMKISAGWAISIVKIDPENCEFYQSLMEEKSLKEKLSLVQKALADNELYQSLVATKSQIAKIQKKHKESCKLA